MTAVLDADPAERARLGTYARETVFRHYSMDTMSDDAIKLYISVIKRSLVNEVDASELDDIESYLKFNPLRAKKRRADVMISGYYGFGNMGDDSILETIIGRLKRYAPDIKITALTRHPKENEKEFGVRCISRTNIFSIIREMRKSSVLISGGGSLFQDSTSSKSLKYYAGIVNLAHRMGMKTYIYANGVGMIYSDKNKALTAKTVSRADRLSVRDASSFDELTSIGVDRGRIDLTADPAFMMEPFSEVETDKIYDKYGLPKDKPFFAVSLRRFEGHQKSAYSEGDLLSTVLSSCADTAKRYGMLPVFVSMQPALDYEISSIASERLRAELGVDSLMISPENGRELLSILSGCDGIRGAAFVCSMRLHILIYACRAALPIVGLSLDPKIDAFTASLKYSGLVGIEGLAEDDLKRSMSFAAEYTDEMKEELAEASRNFRLEAERDVEAVFGLLR